MMMDPVSFWLWYSSVWSKAYMEAMGAFWSVPPRDELEHESAMKTLAAELETREIEEIISSNTRK